MRRFINNLPTDVTHYGYESFNVGLQRIGYERVRSIKDPDKTDLFIVWNRQGTIGARAQQFEQSSGRVLVIENGWLGKHWRGAQWYAVALDHHAGGGVWPDLGPSRWHSWAVPLAPWRAGGEIVVLGQRGIGEPGVRSPTDWHRDIAKKLSVPVRIRLHPGGAAAAKKATPLEEDLANAGAVCTWASAAGIHALMLGVPVFYGYANWIGARASRPLSQFSLGPVCDDALRLAMFERLSWAMWTRAEIESGEALALLLPNTCEAQIA